jgi:hypothetical protein
MKKLIDLIKTTLIELKNFYLDAISSDKKFFKYFFGYFIPICLVIELIIAPIKAVGHIISLIIGTMLIIWMIENDVV